MHANRSGSATAVCTRVTPFPSAQIAVLSRIPAANTVAPSRSWSARRSSALRMRTPAVRVHRPRDTVQTYTRDLQTLLKQRQDDVRERNRQIADGVFAGGERSQAAPSDTEDRGGATCPQLRAARERGSVVDARRRSLRPPCSPASRTAGTLNRRSSRRRRKNCDRPHPVSN
jgi:hypothetical protein